MRMVGSYGVRAVICSAAGEGIYVRSGEWINGYIRIHSQNDNIGDMAKQGHADNQSETCTRDSTSGLS